MRSLRVYILYTKRVRGLKYLHLMYITRHNDSLTILSLHIVVETPSVYLIQSLCPFDLITQFNAITLFIAITFHHFFKFHDNLDIKHLL